MNIMWWEVHIISCKELQQLNTMPEIARSRLVMTKQHTFQPDINYITSYKLYLFLINNNIIRTTYFLQDASLLKNKFKQT